MKEKQRMEKKKKADIRWGFVCSFWFWVYPKPVFQVCGFVVCWFRVVRVNPQPQTFFPYIGVQVPNNQRPTRLPVVSIVVPFLGYLLGSLI